MAIFGGSKNLKLVTEVSAIKTILGRELIEVPDGGGVFPSYPIKCQYGFFTFEVDDQGRKLRLITKDTTEQELVLDQNAIYALFLKPVIVEENGVSVNTCLGELLCTEVDAIIKAHLCAQVILAQPASQDAIVNQEISLRVQIRPTVVAKDQMTFSWYQNGNLIPDAVEEEITVSCSETSGFYAIVSTPYGNVQTSTATVTIVAE